MSNQKNLTPAITESKSAKPKPVILPPLERVLWDDQATNVIDTEVKKETKSTTKGKIYKDRIITAVAKAVRKNIRKSNYFDEEQPVKIL